MAELTVPQVDFSSLGKLGAVYKQSQNEQKLADLGRGLSDGTVDYRQAAAQTAGMGDITHTLQFLALAEAQKKQGLEQQASADFNKGVGGMFGARPGPASPMPNPMPVPGAAPAAPMASADPGAPSVAPRAPVQSSSRVWGDQEAEAAGLYEPPAKPTTLAALNPTAQAPAPRAPAPQAPTVTAQAAPPAEPAGQVGPQHIPVLLQALGNPNLPAGQKETAKLLLTEAFKNSKEPERVQLLDALKRRPDLLEIEKQLRASTTVNIDQKGQTEEEKAAGKSAGERRAALMSAAAAAPMKLQNVARMEALLDQVKQGKLEPARMTVSAWAKSFGLDDKVAESLGLDPKAVGSAQSLQSLVNESVVSKIGAGGFPANNFSNTDRSFLVDIEPKLGDDEVANKIRTEAKRRVANLELQAGKDYNAWRRDPTNKGKGFEDFEVEHADKISKMDIFGDLIEKAKTSRPRSSSAQDNGAAKQVPFTKVEIDGSLANARAKIAKSNGDPAVRDFVIKKLRDNGLPTDGL